MYKKSEIFKKDQFLAPEIAKNCQFLVPKMKARNLFWPEKSPKNVSFWDPEIVKKNLESPYGLTRCCRSPVFYLKMYD